MNERSDETEKFEELVENKLTENNRNLPSFKKDSTDFLIKLRKFRQYQMS